MKNKQFLNINGGEEVSIYAIGDLHLSFGANKPMDIFGENWTNHAEKIKKDWLTKVKDEDTVILAGDFSWAMKLEDTIKDFKYICCLPGRKILLKGNHDYWWTTVTNMRKFLIEKDFQNIDFLYNNSYEINDKIICGTRGWSLSEENIEEEKKIIDREVARLKLSIEDGIAKYGNNKEIIVFFHYPPITQANIIKNEITPFLNILIDYNIKECYYGHLHGNSIKDAVQGNIHDIDLQLISADGVDFKLKKIV